MKKKIIYNISGVLWLSLVIIGILLLFISNNSFIGKAKYDAMYIIDSIGVISLVLGLITLLTRTILFFTDKSLPPIFFKGPFSKSRDQHRNKEAN